MNFTLVNLDTTARQLGRGVVFYAPYWTGVADISLTMLGDTEGDITLNPNSELGYLTAPEVRGPAKLLGYEMGANPTIDLSVWFGDPALRAICSPTGSGSIGRNRRVPVTRYTIAIFPEEMFRIAATNALMVVGYTTAGGWTVNSVAMTAEQLRNLGHSFWAWNCHFTRPPITLRTAGGDAVDKSLDSLQIQVMVDTTKPDGHQLITLGNPITAGVVLDVA